jgi:hypothetical protein
MLIFLKKVSPLKIFKEDTKWIIELESYSLQPKAIVICSLGFTADILYP